MSREMKDSGIEWIGDIPREWESTRLKHLGKFVNGYAFKPEQWGYTGKRIIRIQDLTGSNDNPNYFDGEIDIKYHINNGDILVSWAATLDAFIWNKGEGLLNQHIFKAVHNKELISYEFFYWLLKETMENMNNDNKHGIVMQHVTLDVFNNFKVPLPNIVEQQRIAAFLDTQCAHIDSVIEKTRAAIEEYKRLKQSVITQAVTKGIRPNREMKDSGIEWIGEIPKEWVCEKFKYIARVKANLVHPDGYGDYQQVSPENIEKGTGKILPCKTVKETGVISDNHLFQKGQILYSKIRPILNKVAIAPFDGLCSADMYPIETDINKYYLLYALLSDSYLVNIRLITEDRVKMPKINQEELSNIFFAIPEESEQSEIVAYLEEKTAAIDSLIQKKEQLITELESYKKSLIYEYVTGKKEVI